MTPTGGMRPRGHEFEALGLRHTFRRAKKWPPPPPGGRQRRRTRPRRKDRRSAARTACERSSWKSASLLGGADRGLGARMAHGEGAHLLEVNEGVVGVIPARCDASRSTHLPAGAAHTDVAKASNLEGPDNTRKLMPRKEVTSR